MVFIIKKSSFFIFLFLFVNFFSFYYNLNSVKATNYGLYDSSSLNTNYEFKLNTPSENTSYANRICTENFEYDSGTNLSSLNEIYWDRDVSVIVQDFNDIDYKYSNNTYKSKLAKVTALKNACLFQLQYHLTSEIALSEIRFRQIIKKDDLFLYYNTFQFKTGNSMYFYFDLYTGALNLYIGSTLVYQNLTFLPINYDYLFVEYDRYLITTTYDIFIRVDAYKQNGYKVKSSQAQIQLESIRNEVIDYYMLQTYLPLINDDFSIVGLDFNFIQFKDVLYQDAFYNYFYNAYDLNQFYLTNVPVYLKDFRKTQISSTWIKATTNYQYRYLNYKTNGSDYYTSTSNALIDSVNSDLENSFNMRFELGFNHTHSYTSYLTLFFNHSFFKFSIEDYMIGLVTFNYTGIIFSSINASSLILDLQFKNKILIVTTLIDFKQYVYNYYIDDKFQRLALDDIQILNALVKPLTTESIIFYQNISSRLHILDDQLTFRSKVHQINTYNSFMNLITIPTFNKKSIEIDGVTYGLISSKIYSIKITCIRSYSTGVISITDNDKSYDFFIGTSSLTKIITTQLLYNKEYGILRLNTIFANSPVQNFILSIKIEVNRFLIYSDQIPQNNLLIAKALEILIPFMIFGLIIIGFYSNSNSKYMAIVGMYIGLFVLYLLEYMSLLFMILCIIFQTLGLYFIIKNEKDGKI